MRGIKFSWQSFHKMLIFAGKTMHNSLLEIFESTFDDRKLSSSERKALSEILNEKDLDNKDLNYLRNRIFEFAKGELMFYSSIEVINWLEKVNKVLVKYQQKEAKTQEENEVYFSPGEACRKAIIRNLHQAQREILICVFTISDNKISDEIFKLYKKGISVKIITDDDKTWDKGSDIYFLAKEGVEIHTDETPPGGFRGIS